MDPEKPHESTVDGSAIQPQQPADVHANPAKKERRSSSSSRSEHKGPPGGYDDTLPESLSTPGYTVKITFHRASKLPIADLSTLSSDPFLRAELLTDRPMRHKEDPILQFRSQTFWATTDPVWNEDWVLANVPASGFKMKIRIFDEDSSDRDDRLGNVHVLVPGIDESWEGIDDRAFKIKKRSGSKRAYLLRALAVCFGQKKEMSGYLNISVKVLGRTTDAKDVRVYTIGPNYWCKHYSPLLGRIVGSKEPTAQAQQPVQDDDEESEVKTIERFHNEEAAPSQRLPEPIPVVDENAPPLPKAAQRVTKAAAKRSHQHNARVSKPGSYNFQANQFQLTGPVPPELYHRYVEFRPFIRALYTSKGLRGLLLNKALHRQHVQVYNFNRSTEYGSFRGPCEEMTRRFLDLVHHDEGSKIFTYVVSLDGLMRFTETGKEFSIDLLSKHTMHSDASIYIAYSGEFFVRRMKKPMRNGKVVDDESRSRPRTGGSQSQSNAGTPSASHPTSPGQSHHFSFFHRHRSHDSNPTHSPHEDLDDGPPNGPPPKDPAYYCLYIDNDSGTYRPNGKLLPLLRKFLEQNLINLGKIVTYDCVAQADKMNKMKGEQRARKAEQQRAKHGGQRVVYAQPGDTDTDSVSSSDEEALDQQAQQLRQEEQTDKRNSVRRKPVPSDHYSRAAAASFSSSARPPSGAYGPAPGPGAAVTTDDAQPVTPPNNTQQGLPPTPPSGVSRHASRTPPRSSTDFRRFPSPTPGPGVHPGASGMGATSSGGGTGTGIIRGPWTGETDPDNYRRSPEPTSARPGSNALSSAEQGSISTSAIGGIAGDRYSYSHSPTSSYKYAQAQRLPASGSARAGQGPGPGPQPGQGQELSSALGSVDGAGQAAAPPAAARVSGEEHLHPAERSVQQEDDDRGMHKLAEAMGPLVGEHKTMRRALDKYGHR